MTWLLGDQDLPGSCGKKRVHFATVTQLRPREFPTVNLHLFTVPAVDFNTIVVLCASEDAVFLVGKMRWSHCRCVHVGWWECPVKFAIQPRHVNLIFIEPVTFPFVQRKVLTELPLMWSSDSLTARKRAISLVMRMAALKPETPVCHDLVSSPSHSVIYHPSIPIFSCHVTSQHITV